MHEGTVSKRDTREFNHVILGMRNAYKHVRGKQLYCNMITGHDAGMNAMRPRHTHTCTDIMGKHVLCLETTLLAITQTTIDPQ